MKKALALLLAGIAVLSLCACGSRTVPYQSKPTTGEVQKTGTKTETESREPDVSASTDEAQAPSVPESLFLGYIDSMLQHYEKYGAISSSHTVERDPDESTHQETVTIDVSIDAEYFYMKREAKLVYQYYSSDDIWKAMNLNSYNLPNWDTLYEELHWDRMLGTWSGSSKTLEYMIDVERIDLENMTVTLSYEIVDSYWGTDYYSGSGTFEINGNNKATFRPDGGTMFTLTFGREGVCLYNV